MAITPDNVDACVRRWRRQRCVPDKYHDDLVQEAWAAGLEFAWDGQIIHAALQRFMDHEHAQPLLECDLPDKESGDRMDFDDFPRPSVTV